MPQTAGAAVPIVLAAAQAVADTVWMSICVYTASNPHALNRMMNTLKSLPGLWVQIKQFAKDLENKAKEKAEKNKSKNAFGFGVELKDEIEKLFVHVKDDSKIEGFDEYDGVFAGIFERSSKKSSTSASSYSNMNSGGGSATPPDPEKEPRNERKERIVDTAEGRNECWNLMKKSGEWESVSGYDKSTLRNKDTGDLAQKSIEKWEIEVYNKREAHIGVIKPSDGRFHPELRVPGRMMRK